MSYWEAIELLAQRMDMCERLEASSMGFSYDSRGSARAEGRYATQVLARLTGKPYDVVLADISALFAFAAWLPFDPSTGEQAEFGMVLLPGLLIVAGSVCGQFIGENIDGRIFHKVWKSGEGSHVKAALCSNVVSIPIDTVIMCCIAFGLTVPLDTLAATIGANIAIKYVVMLASVAVYAAASRR